MSDRPGRVVHALLRGRRIVGQRFCAHIVATTGGR
jgi:hypothetical protein